MQDEVYKVRVNNSFDYTFTRKEIEALDSTLVEAGSYHALLDSQAYQSRIVSSDVDQKKYTLEVNQEPFEIEIFDALDALVDQMGLSSGKVKMVSALKAPMPGLILDILVAQGDEVKEEDALVILEAMKMENVMASPRAGKIKSVSVVKGDAVEKNAVLIEFE